jgi:thiamine-monophosphate kinase
MKVSELGEFRLIDRLAKMAGGGRDEQLIIGIGDDAAAWKGDASIQLATVDSFIQDVHYPSGTASWPELGWKALAVNLSDIAAMGGLPRYALVSLALPPQTEVDDVIALYTGMLELAREYKVTIVGGDISNAPLVVISITVLGSSPQQRILTRSSAKPGELVAVTGHLGAAAAGLEMLTKKLEFEAKVTAHLKQAFFKPTPRLAEGQLLLEQGVKTAIDISDGLVADLNQICKASRVGARIDTERVPVEPMVKAVFGERALELALTGGEDYELLFTAKAEVIARIKKAGTCPISAIGEIVAGQGVTVADHRGKPLELGRAGWEHFTSR